MQMQPETANEILDTSQNCQTPKNDSVADVSNRNVPLTKGSSHPGLKISFHDVANDPIVTNTLEINSKKTASPSAKAKSKLYLPKMRKQILIFCNKDW